MAKLQRTVRYGPGDKDFWVLRVQGVNVRFQDQNISHGTHAFVLTPAQATDMSNKLLYIAKRCREIVLAAQAAPQDGAPSP